MKTHRWRNLAVWGRPIIRSPQTWAWDLFERGCMMPIHPSCYFISLCHSSVTLHLGCCYPVRRHNDSLRSILSKIGGHVWSTNLFSPRSHWFPVPVQLLRSDIHWLGDVSLAGACVRAEGFVQTIQIVHPDSLSISKCPPRDKVVHAGLPRSAHSAVFEGVTLVAFVNTVCTKTEQKFPWSEGQF